MAQATRGFHPLHFEDLDPHRFEDLVRQLAYEFRPWRQLEATGRPGADEGFDARGWEILNAENEVPARDDEEAEDEALTSTDRLWLIQCKREKSIGPTKLVGYVNDIPEDEAKRLYGVVLAAACDFSKKARDGFRARCAKLGVSECYLWGKGELEDMLYQPKNDHLLFAYFGISLTIRQRSLKTQIRSRLAMKRKAYRLLKDKAHRCLVIHDPDDKHYPRRDDVPDFDKRPHWVVLRFEGFTTEGLKFVARRYMAYLDDQTEQWDAAFAYDDAKLDYQENPWIADENRRDFDRRSEIMRVWDQFPEHNRAWFEVFRILPYENTIDIDEHGDGYVREPHIYATFKNGSPFAFGYAKVESIGFDRRKRYINMKEEGRIAKFPEDMREGPDRPKTGAAPKTKEQTGATPAAAADGQ